MFFNEVFHCHSLCIFFDPLFLLFLMFLFKIKLKPSLSQLERMQRLMSGFCLRISGPETRLFSGQCAESHSKNHIMILFLPGHLVIKQTDAYLPIYLNCRLIKIKLWLWLEWDLFLYTRQQHTTTAVVLRELIKNGRLLIVNS